MITMVPKGTDKRAVVPERSILLTRKPLEHFQTVSSELSQDGTRVMQFVGR